MFFVKLKYATANILNPCLEDWLPSVCHQARFSMKFAQLICDSKHDESFLYYVTQLTCFYVRFIVAQKKHNRGTACLAFIPLLLHPSCLTSAFLSHNNVK